MDKMGDCVVYMCDCLGMVQVGLCGRIGFSDESSSETRFEQADQGKHGQGKCALRKPWNI